MPASGIQPRGAHVRWDARLELGFSAGRGRTVLSGRRHRGPLTLQKPFYPGDGVCHAYILHPPGGMAPGDHLRVDVRAGERTAVLLTTPAAGKCYRSDGRPASLNQTLAVAEGAALEWLPQENILFDGCDVDLCTRVDLAAGAKFIGWETVCLGRPAAGEGFDGGRARQHLELWREGRPLLVERSLFRGGSDLLGAAWGMDGNTVSAMLVAVGADGRCLERANALSDEAAGLAGATLIDDVLVCRYLGGKAEAARRYFVGLWRALRPLLLQREPQIPRIWNT